MDGISVVHEGDVLVAEISASLRSFVSHRDMLTICNESRMGFSREHAAVYVHNLVICNIL